MMRTLTVLICPCLVTVFAVCPTRGASAQPPASLTAGVILELDTELAEALRVDSSVRKKLALRRVAREAESLLEKYAEAPGRYELMHVLFRTQQAQFRLDESEAHRDAILKTCEMLAEAPDDYASIRWEADLLLTQSRLATRREELPRRADALRQLTERYLSTSVAKEVVRVVLLMAIESGESTLIEDLETLIGERFADDLSMIAFRRNHLPAKIFGATLFADLKDTQGNLFRFPMDNFGNATAVFFWSNDEPGRAKLKEMAETLAERESTGERRIEILSVNVDELSDAGESILREHGLPWRAMHLPEGRDSLIYQAYARNDPKVFSISPTGIAVLFQTGGNMHGKGFKRWYGSVHARSWVEPVYVSAVRSLATAEFLVLDPTGTFDPAAPPELKAVSPHTPASGALFERTDRSVPVDVLLEIQACFVAPPQRYHTPRNEMIERYERGVSLAARAIESYPEAPDLWLVRNRRIVALTALWKLKLDSRFLETAAVDAQAAIDGGMPEGTDAIARLCLARKSLRLPDADLHRVLRGLARRGEDGQGDLPTLAVACLLALESGDREAYAEYRKKLLAEHGNTPAVWTLTAFMLDRYHQHWLYEMPFMSGRISPRIQQYAMTNAKPEDHVRRFEFSLKTLDGKTVDFSHRSGDQWTILRFRPLRQIDQISGKPDAFIEARPFTDVRIFEVVLDDRVEEIRSALIGRKDAAAYPVLHVSSEASKAIERKFGMIQDHSRPSIVVLRPDGSVALAASAMTYRGLGRSDDLVSSLFNGQDEAAVDELLAAGQLEKAKTLAFAHAPVGDAPPADARIKSKPSSISTEHLRARAKVYAALGDWDAAAADVDQVHQRLMDHANSVGTRTKGLDEVEALRARIAKELGQPMSAP